MWETVVVVVGCQLVVVRISFMQASKESLEPVFSVLINAVGLCRQCLSSWEYQGLYAKWDSFSEKSIPQQPHSKDNWQHMEIQVQASPPYQTET